MVVAVKNGVDLATKAARYFPTDADPIPVPNLSVLSEGDRKALSKVVEAAKLMDEIFLRQVWEGNASMREELRAQPESRNLLRYFSVNQGPWDRLDENEPFIEGVPTKRDGATYYPSDMTRDEFELWVSTLSSEDKANAQGFYHVIRRDAKGLLTAVPYCKEYAEFLRPAAAHLREAVELVSDTSLATFLGAIADAFENNDYEKSDSAWVDVGASSPLEITIGPYEVYEDSLFDAKAAFVAYIGITDTDSTNKLARFSDLMQELEDNLPVDPQFRNPTLGEGRLITVVNQVYAAGDCAGVQTAAYNLPNNEKVIHEKGSKMVILKNVQERKFEKILLPIADLAICASQRPHVTFDAFFTHILAHEMCHTLGPHLITGPDGEKRAVRECLQETFSTIEEAKADILGLWTLQYQIDRGMISADFMLPLYVTFLASSFRSIRFGLDEAHGKGQAIQLTYMLQRGAVTYDPATCKYSVLVDKMPAVVTDLARTILTLQGTGDKAGTQQLMDSLGVLTSEVAQTLSGLTKNCIPVDIQRLCLL
eukprot:comp23342_c0_seq2/m.38499 comp23342_c0_seq2/g.38499  ORF comp23342_c0_seq2/g.38499 comp23342_c0_seq2/m.38499 type:complete len:538 (-) comp23342_c0_seq2:470-2083(-)